MKRRSQYEHNAINAREYPGTRELCVVCDTPTGHAGRGDGSLYCGGCGRGPFCDACYEGHAREERLVAALEVEA